MIYGNEMYWHDSIAAASFLGANAMWLVSRKYLSTQNYRTKQDEMLWNSWTPVTTYFIFFRRSAEGRDAQKSKYPDMMPTTIWKTHHRQIIY